MAEFIWPSVLVPNATNLSIVDSAGRFSSPLSGFTRTVSRPGERLRLSLRFQHLNGQSRTALQSCVAALRGATHRVWVHDHANRIRGSFSAPELLTNPTFLNGTTGWTAQQSTLTASERVLRLTVSKNTATGAPGFTQTPSVTQYAPHVLRGFLGARSRSGLNAGTWADGVSNYSADAQGLITQMFVPLGTTAVIYPAVFDSDENVSMTGDWLECPFSSVSRCALVDNRPNAMTRSDEIDHADWTKTRLTVLANNQTAPDGTTTAEKLTEDSSTDTHQFLPATHPTRTSVAEDLMVFGCFRREVGTRNIQLRVGSDSSNHGSAHFDLGAGTTGTLINTGTATNTRSFIVSLGQNGWYLCFVIARCAASTQIYSQYNMVSAGSNNYTGDSTSAISAWRCGCARSSFPVTPAQTVATAAPTGALQNLAGGIYTKGWPVSTNGLLLPGDQVQIGSQLVFVTAPLNSDAAGLGQLQFSPALRVAAANNAPVVVNQPMGKFFLDQNENGWTNDPGIFSDAEIVLAEAA